MWVVAESAAAARAAAALRVSAPVGDVEVVQDEDVLDTWFSSALCARWQPARVFVEWVLMCGDGAQIPNFDARLAGWWWCPLVGC